MRRNSIGQDIAKSMLETIKRVFITVNEDPIFNKAVEAALSEASSGFNAYFMPLTLKVKALLITDGESMAVHARNLKELGF